MKKLIFILLLLPTFVIGQDVSSDTYIKIEAKKWRKGEMNLPWEYFETRILKNLAGNRSIKTDKVNQFGSLISKQTKGNGFFRVEKISNRWWVVDPDGFYNIQRCVNGLRQGSSEQNVRFFNQVYGSNSKWIEKTAEKFREIGFNGSGSWSTDTIIQTYNNSKEVKTKLSYSMNLSLMASYGRLRGGIYQLPGNIGYPNQAIFVFDPEFETFCDTIVKTMISKLKSDPNLFGYFSDNELPFGSKNLEAYLTLENPNDWGRLAAEKWLKEKRITKDKITDVERNEFAGYVADKYYQVVSKAIKRTDPNHLFLGSRLHGQAKFIPEVMNAAGRYCDIISINYYGVWTPQKKHLDSWAAWTNKPFIITEFYTKAMDSGLLNLTGAGYTVRTQRDRGYSYQDFSLALLESKSCVGWHWFKYQDNDPTAVGVDPSNVDSNKGLVNNRYDYYTELIELMQELNNQVYSLIDYFDKHNLHY